MSIELFDKEEIVDRLKSIDRSLTYIYEKIIDHEKGIKDFYKNKAEDLREEFKEIIDLKDKIKESLEDLEEEEGVTLTKLFFQFWKDYDSTFNAIQDIKDKISNIGYFIAFISLVVLIAGLICIFH